MTGLEPAIQVIKITFDAIQLIFIAAGIIIFSFSLALAEAIWRKIRGVGRRDIRSKKW